MADPELDAMAALSEALGPLEGTARERVLRWAADKFEVPSALPRQRAAEIDEGSDGELEFKDVGDLVHAAQPVGGPQHALVVAYWFQEVQGQDGWSGADINTTLRNMGQGLANVTTTLDSLKAKKPQLVMQVGKAGRSRQARKTYKLTTAGVREVRQMLAKGADGAVS
jgi:hypothetical protein